METSAGHIANRDCIFFVGLRIVADGNGCGRIRRSDPANGNRLKASNRRVTHRDRLIADCIGIRTIYCRTATGGIGNVTAGRREHSACRRQCAVASVPLAVDCSADAIALLPIAVDSKQVAWVAAP